MQISLGLLRPIILLTTLFASQAQAANFTFSFSEPSQCDNFAVTWTGGTAPYTLQLTPVFGSQRIFNIPDSSFSNGKGTFETQLLFAKDSQFLVTMSDASGFATGGTSGVLKVEDSVGKQTCNTTDPGVDFTFEANSALQQCRPFTIDHYDGAQQPITITAIIPGGQSVILNPPTGPTSFDWTADVAAGTSIVFVLMDSKGRKGGSSDIRVVGVTDDKTCLDSNSPTSASITPSPTASQVSSTGGVTSPTTGSDNAPASHKISGAVIAGAIAAAVFAIATVVVLVIFLLRRRKKDGHQRFGSIDLNDGPPGPNDQHPATVINPYPMTPASRSTTSPSQHNLLGSGSQYTRSDYPPTMSPPSTYTASAYGATGYGPPSAYGDQSYHGTSLYATTAGSHARHPSNARSAATMSSNDRTSMWDGTTITAAARKAAAAGIPVNPNPVPARFIMHTDLEDTVPPLPVQDEVIELPPQYSERRAPLPGFNGDAGASGSGRRSEKDPRDFAPPPPTSPPPPPPPGPSRS